MIRHSEKSGVIHDEPWASTVPQAEMEDLFVGWSPYVQNVLGVSTFVTQSVPYSNYYRHLSSLENPLVGS